MTELQKFPLIYNRGWGIDHWVVSDYNNATGQLDCTCYVTLAEAEAALQKIVARRKAAGHYN